MLIDLVTAAINANVRQDILLNKPKVKILEVNRGKTMVPDLKPSFRNQIIECTCVHWLYDFYPYAYLNLLLT